MEWTPEAIRAETDYRLETARRYAVAREFRKSRSRHPSWWKRLRARH
jgi:hypothetical protein